MNKFVVTPMGQEYLQYMNDDLKYYMRNSLLSPQKLVKQNISRTTFQNSKTSFNKTQQQLNEISVSQGNLPSFIKDRLNKVDKLSQTKASYSISPFNSPNQKAQILLSETQKLIQIMKAKQAKELDKEFQQKLKKAIQKTKNIGQNDTFENQFKVDKEFLEFQNTFCDRRLTSTVPNNRLKEIIQKSHNIRYQNNWKEQNFLIRNQKIQQQYALKKATSLTSLDRLELKFLKQPQEQKKKPELKLIPSYSIRQ